MPDSRSSQVLIVGVDGIARELGLSPTQVKRRLLASPGFPACRIVPGGNWITTRDKLYRWADKLVPDPDAATEPAGRARLNPAEPPEYHHKGGGARSQGSGES